MLSAKEANELTIKASVGNSRKQLEDIEAEIKQAISKEEFSVYYNRDRLSSYTMNTLKELGYKVYNKSDQFELMYKIEW